MSIADEVLLEAAGLENLTALGGIIAAVERPLVALGATHFLACGLPLPGRTVDPLLIRIRWGDVRTDLGSLVSVPASDPVIIACRNHLEPFVMTGPDLPPNSELVSATGYANNPRATLVAVPCHRVPNYQAAVIAMGPELVVDEPLLMKMDFIVTRIFKRLDKLGYFVEGRPGELSARERSVVALSARGHTAQEIAEMLEISQRTVNAHLQNSADKLHAANKTQTVVEALRYGQIMISDISPE